MWDNLQGWSWLHRFVHILSSVLQRLRDLLCVCRISVFAAKQQVTGRQALASNEFHQPKSLDSAAKKIPVPSMSKAGLEPGWWPSARRHSSPEGCNGSTDTMIGGLSVGHTQPRTPGRSRSKPIDPAKQLKNGEQKESISVLHNNGSSGILKAAAVGGLQWDIHRTGWNW